jgi:hypothetical protein
MSQPTPLGYPHAGAGTVEILLEKEDGADFAVLFSPDPNNILLSTQDYLNIQMGDLSLLCRYLNQKEILRQ